MSIERAEKLKEILTDKFVVVDADVPELRRFENWTGKVKTVNMNCRALVEFNGPVDIGWYDIDPDFLKIVDEPVKKAPAPVAKAAPAKPAAAAPTAKPATPAGKSPLDAIRAQQSAKAASAPATAKASPLDLIRKQQAAKAATAATVDTPPEIASAPATAVQEVKSTDPPSVAETPAAPPAETPSPQPIPTTGPDGRPLSKLEIIRMQQAARKK